jgi:hypothetical protein
LFAIEQIVNGLRHGFEGPKLPEDRQHAPPNDMMLNKVGRP